eukprot:TRINITY_DN3030_c0_g1_i2.p1 TRINITY_DN3030_c0_g1~~TRINITY_DN3030_c0_g1_i2.p1  ORF type:complete len:831 (+),score=103.96 TRINITY_DN3030_c0_g1_i2:74-2494(+)
MFGVASTCQAQLNRLSITRVNFLLSPPRYHSHSHTNDRDMPEYGGPPHSSSASYSSFTERDTVRVRTSRRWITISAQVRQPDPFSWDELGREGETVDERGEREEREELQLEEEERAGSQRGALPYQSQWSQRTRPHRSQLQSQTQSLDPVGVDTTLRADTNAQWDADDEPEGDSMPPDYPDYAAMVRSIRADNVSPSFWRGSFPWDAHVQTVLAETFGLERLRPLQQEALNAIICGKSVLACFASGGGKSLLYQLPGLLTNGVTLVVSPLVALIQDQMAACHKVGISVRTLSGAMHPGAHSRIFREMTEPEPDFKFLFITPEKLSQSSPFREALEVMYENGNIQRFVVDEAHCISEWGHDFRTDYRRLCDFVQRFPDVPVLALSGSSTATTKADIQEQLEIQSGLVFQSSLSRENIWLEVRDRFHGEVAADVLDYIQREQYATESGLIYCLTRNDAAKLAESLELAGLSCLSYHGAMNIDERAAVQKLWSTGEVKVLCTTVAFGLGIDKADVRFVIHACMPTSLEAYYQQIGRAGRDGRASKAVMLFSYKDKLRVERVVNGERHDVEISRELKDVKSEKLDDVVHYALVDRCRHSFLLSYFDQQFRCDPTRNLCDMCEILASRATKQTVRSSYSARTSSQHREGQRGELASSASLTWQSADLFETSVSPRLAPSSVSPFATANTSPSFATPSAPTPTFTTTQTLSSKRPTQAPVLSVDDAFLSTEDDFLSVIPSHRKAEAKLIARLAALPNASLLSKTALRRVVRAQPDSLAAVSAVRGVGAAKGRILGRDILACLEQARESGGSE